MYKFCIFILLVSIFFSCSDKGDIVPSGNLPVETTSEKTDKTSDGADVQEEQEEQEEYADIEEGTDDYIDITWWNLISEEEFNYYQELNKAYDYDPEYQPESDPPAPGINPGADNIKIRIPGYLVGMDADPDNFTMVTSFLFVPYQGACIHVPAPPANQTIFVTVEEPVRSDPYMAFTLSGTIYLEEGDNEMASYSYLMTGDLLEPYDMSF